MKIRLHIAAALSMSVAAPVAAQEPTPSLPAVRVEAVFHVADCARRVLPGQRQVGEWTSQHNFSQVYDTRRRLMAQIARACQRDGVTGVQIVSSSAAPPRDLRLVAFMHLPPAEGPGNAR